MVNLVKNQALCHRMRDRKRPRLSVEPPRVGDRWEVQQADGSKELYACCIDACRAQSVANATYSLERELASVKLAWATELGSAARSDKSRYGHVAVPLSSSRACCVELLLDDAMQRSTPFPAPLSVCPGRSRSTSMASGTPTCCGLARA